MATFFVCLLPYLSVLSHLKDTIIHKETDGIQHLRLVKAFALRHHFAYRLRRLANDTHQTAFNRLITN